MSEREVDRERWRGTEMERRKKKRVNKREGVEEEGETDWATPAGSHVQRGGKRVVRES